MHIAYLGNRRGHRSIVLAVLAGAAIFVTSVTAASVMLPIHGVFQVATTPVFNSNNPCIFTNTERGSGTVMHVGATTWESKEVGHFDSCINGAPGGPDITVYGAFKMTASNGDEIRGAYTTWGTLDQSGVKVRGPIMFLSGTGRFKNVKGGGVLTAEAKVMTEAAGEIEGLIKY